MTEGKKRQAKVTTNRLGLPLSIPFFILFYLYFLFEIDPRLIYHGAGLIDNFPTFFKGWDFLEKFLAYPGGLLTYASAFLAQFFYYAWTGAAVVTAQVWAMCLCIDAILSNLGLARWRNIRFVPALLLLAVYSQYAFHFALTMGFLVALVATCLYLRCRPKSSIAATTLFLVISIALYILAGGTFLLFALMCGSIETLFRRSRWVGPIQWASGAALPYILGVFVYGQWIHDAYFELLPLSWKVTDYEASKLMLKAIYGLFLFLPAVLLILGSWRLLWQQITAARQKEPREESDPGTLTRILDSLGSRRLGLNIATLIVAAASVGVLAFYRDTKLRTLYQVDYYLHQRMWPEVIELGRKSPYHYLTCHAVNRALYQTQRLGDELFAFPQHPSALLLTGPKALWQKFETCMDLGLINEAENAMAVSLESLGPRPLLLERLAVVNIVKGNTGTARVFLQALAKVPFWGAIAQDYLSRLKTDPTLSQDSEIQRLRSVRLRTDYVRQADSFGLLLAENPQNRMAYEYSMARLLLSTANAGNPRNLALFAEMFEKLHARNMSRIPKCYEEALLLYRALNKLPLDVPGQPLAPETRDRLQVVLDAVKKHGKDKKALRADLADKVGDSYFYYFFVGG